MSNDDNAIRIKVKGAEYQVAPPFTNRELHVIKQIAGVRAGELWDALMAGDNDMTVALAHIGVLRVGAARPTLDELWDLPAGEILVESPEGEDPTPAGASDGAASDPNGGSPVTDPKVGGAGSTATTST